MQTLKEEIRNQILRAALDEFHASGYADASMKRIAQRAGVAVGNLYHYFKDKNTLFEQIVTPVFLQITQLIRDENLHAGETAEELEALIAAQSQQIAELVKLNYKQLGALLFGSQGTRFENTQQFLVDILAEHIAAELVQYHRNLQQPLDTSLAHPLAASFLAGYFDMIRTYQDEEVIRKLAMEYMRLYLPMFHQMR